MVSPEMTGLRSCPDKAWRDQPGRDQLGNSGEQPEYSLLLGFNGWGKLNDPPVGQMLGGARRYVARQGRDPASSGNGRARRPHLHQKQIAVAATAAGQAGLRGVLQNPGGLAGR